MSKPPRLLVEILDSIDEVIALLPTVDGATVTVDVAPAVAPIAPMEERRCYSKPVHMWDTSILMLNETVGRALFRFSTQTHSYSEYLPGSSAMYSPSSSAGVML